MTRPKLFICDRCETRFDIPPDYCPSCGEEIAGRLDPGFRGAVERFHRKRRLQLMLIVLGVFFVSMLGVVGFRLLSSTRSSLVAGRGTGSGLRTWGYDADAPPFPDIPSTSAEFDCILQTVRSIQGEPNTFRGGEEIRLVMKVTNLDVGPAARRIGDSGVPVLWVKDLETGRLLDRKSAGVSVNPVSFEPGEEKTFRPSLRSLGYGTLDPGVYRVRFTLDTSPESKPRSRNVTIIVLE